MNKPILGISGAQDNIEWGTAKVGPTPIAEKTSVVPNLDHKPVGSPFGSGGTTWGSSTSDSSGGQNLETDAGNKHTASSLNTTGPENIPVVKTKLVPTPGSITGKENGRTREREETGTKNPSPTWEKAPERQVEGIEESAESEEAIVAIEDEFDWVKPRRKRKGQIAHVALATSDPGGAICGAGGGGKKKKKKKGKR